MINDKKIQDDNRFMQTLMPSAFNVKGVKLGYIQKIYDEDYLTADVGMATGGEILGVQFPNSNPDRTTDNLHGFVTCPRVGDAVILGFLDAEKEGPVILAIISVPNSGADKEIKRYKGKFDKNNVYIGSYDGSMITFNPVDGNITHEAKKKIQLNVSKGEREVGIARKGDMIMCAKARAGKDFLEWIEQLYNQIDNIINGINNWMPTPQDGGAGLKTSMVNAVTQWTVFKATYPPPEMILGEIASGSTNVTTGR